MTELRLAQRFQNYTKALDQLHEAEKRYQLDVSDMLIQAGLIQCFEFTFELAWKLMKDYVNLKGFEDKTPKDVIRRAFSIEFITQGDVWLEMVESRNRTSHIYDQTISNTITTTVVEHYLPLFDQLKKAIAEVI